MKLGKMIGTAAFATCVGVFGADEKRKHYLFPDLEYGFEALTGYNSNVNNNRDEDGSFLVTFRPFLTLDKEQAWGPLLLSYNPEGRWYEKREAADDVEWDHKATFDTTITLTPTMKLAVSDRFFDIESDDVQEIGGTPVSGGDNDFVRNVLKLDYEWEMRKGSFMTAGYTNEYLEYDDKENEYRNMKSNEVYIGFKRRLNDSALVGLKFDYGRANFWESATDKFSPGTVTDRDVEWYRTLVTAEVSDGPWRYSGHLGLDYHKVMNKTVDGVDDSNLKPYVKLKTDYYFDNKGFKVASAEYLYRTISSYQEDVYFAGQSKVRLSYKHKCSERLDFAIQGSYDDIYYDQKYYRYSGGSDDHETWIRTGFLFTYRWLQDVDLLLGMSHDNLLNAARDNDEYSVNRYDVGFLWKF